MPSDLAGAWREQGPGGHRAAGPTQATVRVASRLVVGEEAARQEVALPVEGELGAATPR